MFFCSKCVKLVPFSILEDYTRADMVALTDMSDLGVECVKLISFSILH